MISRKYRNFESFYRTACDYSVAGRNRVSSPGWGLSLMFTRFAIITSHVNIIPMAECGRLFTGHQVFGYKENSSIDCCVLKKLGNVPPANTLCIVCSVIVLYCPRENYQTLWQVWLLYIWVMAVIIALAAITALTGTATTATELLDSSSLVSYLRDPYHHMPMIITCYFTSKHNHYTTNTNI